MKKGFTLIELIGVIIILGIIALITIPIVDKSIQNGKEKALESQIDSIKLSASLFLNDNKGITLEDGDFLTITLLQLKQGDYVDFDIKNPVNGEFFPNDMLITIRRTAGVITYDVLTDTGTYTWYDDPKSIPTVTLVGNAYEKVNLEDGNYVDKGAVAKSGNGATLTTLTKTPETVSLKTIGTYTITYQVTDNGITSAAVRTIKVCDMEPPVITIPKGNLEITTSQVATYNLLTGVTATDNSGNATLTVESNLSTTKGKYTVTYIATDAAGNVTKKTRFVTVK